MAEFLLEIFSEEIPARMQQKAASDLEKLVTDKLKEAKLSFDGVKSYVTARRLVLVINDLATEQPDVSEERRGPRADAPEKAIEGFLRGAGVAREDLEEREDKKGTFLYAVINQKGRPAREVVSEFMPEIIRNFPWPKSQRWGAGSLRWVRPMHSILCLHGGEVVSFEVDGISSGNKSRGHRFMAPAEFEISNFAEYSEALKSALVVLDRCERIGNIDAEAQALAKNAGLELVEDKALLGEVAGLAEYPVVLMGTFDEEFLDMPAEALTSAMRTHQKYFSVMDSDGKLTNKFIFVSNMKTEDNGAKIIDGNQRVLRARLSDTKFFWDQDLKSKLEDHLPALDEIVFHAKLGTVGDRVKRLEALSGFIAGRISADADKASKAAMLSKSDLVTGMVDECPELQGLMGKYFAIAEGQDAEVADAIADHYSPKGPSDNCPSAPVSIAVAMAEKIDTLVGFFGIDEKPTGSKDPFALRRAALGIIRLVIENNVRINLEDAIMKAATLYSHQLNEADQEFLHNTTIRIDLKTFFWDRLKVYAKDRDIRHDVIGAEFNWDFVCMMAKANALMNFIKTDDGENLLAGFKRAANILKAEEEKDGTSYDGEVDEAALTLEQEKELNVTLCNVAIEAKKALEKEEFEMAMTHLSKLRNPIDAFFDKVTVNSDIETERENRLKLLSHIRSTMNDVIDFSKIEG